MFHRPCHEKVDDMEAVMLTVRRALLARRKARVERTLASVVDSGRARDVTIAVALVGDLMRPVPEFCG